MSNRYLGDVPFKELVTHSINEDKTISKVADALDKVLVPSIKFIPNLLLFARLAHDGNFINPVPMLPSLERLTDLKGGLEELEETTLDYLAWQFHVDGYGVAITKQAKRELIYQSVLLHKKKGTPWSIKHAINTALLFPVELTEWFQWGGKPYFFRVHIDITEMIFDLEIIENIFRIIWDYKNVRSWLEYLETKNTLPMTEYTALCLAGRNENKTYLYFEPPEIPIHNVYTGMCVVSNISCKLSLLT